MSEILAQIAPALSGWLWIMPLAGALGGSAWVFHQLDLGNSARTSFAGHTVHHSVGSADGAIGINLSTRRLLVSTGGGIESYPFSAIRFARPHRDGQALLIGKEGDLIREAYPASRMMVELAIDGRPEHLFVQLFDLDLPRSAFGRFAARQRGFKWLARLHQAVRDDRGTAWGSGSIDTVPDTSGS